ncbi:MAG: ArgP/LysG family DNA-binding transcriptional regulator, partial [Aeromicrobium sp.]|nr:ArgP/LysG family DNA-binding transcriptional regulator [Aeromicrobium sp.]
QLKALVAVVDEGSFETAAAVLHVTPSAVSQRIKALEQSAGQVLVRRTRPAAATDAGAIYVRLGRQIDALVHETLTASEPQVMPTVPIAVNGDSLDTWLLPALQPLADRYAFDLRREDQDHSADLLRAGTVMAAVTADAEPVQGCRSTRLGVMSYQPMASPELAARWFGEGPTIAALAAAPVVVFDRSDDLQDRYVRRRTTRRLTPPRHHVPASSAFLDAVVRGFGWGMLPDQQVADEVAQGHLVPIDPGQRVDVTLHWQQWRLQTPALAAIADAVAAAAAEHLT